MKGALILLGLVAPTTAFAQADIPRASEIRAAGGTVPELVSGPEDTGKEALFAIGNQGDVRIEVTIGADGAVRGTTIAVSSRSPELDSFAASLIARSQFKPARNKAGEAIAVRATVPVHLWKDSLVDGSLESKTCADFVIDADWHAKAFPEQRPTQLRVWLLLTGALAVSQRDGFSRPSPDFQKVYDICRANPARKFTDVYVKEWKRRGGEG